MAIRINNKEYLNYEEQVLENKKDIEELNDAISSTNVALIGKKNKSPNPSRIKTFTKDDFVANGNDKVLSINDDNVDTVAYDSVIIDLEGVGVANGGNVVIKSYMDISLQIHNSSLVTDLAGTRNSISYLSVLIDTPIAKEFNMIKGYRIKEGIGDNGSCVDVIGEEKSFNLEMIMEDRTHIRCDLVIHFSNPVYMIDIFDEL